MCVELHTHELTLLHVPLPTHSKRFLLRV